MTHAARVELAARNNALWCDAVCRAHGSAGRFDADGWWHDAASPPFYPNAVTLRRAVDTPALQARLLALRRVLPAGWGVKDSFASLALEAQGFERLFDATWLWRDSLPCGAGATLAFERIDDATVLADWEAAWRGAATAGATRQFPPGLLDEPGVVVLGARAGTRFIAGGMLNRTDPVLGLSNVFAPAGQDAPAWAGLAAAALRLFPGVPLVGYQQDGAALAAARAAGFAAIGPLRVWLSLRRAPTAARAAARA